MYPNAEPGGDAMWQFMKKVMRARSPSDIPKIDGAAAEFFYDHDEKFTAGTGFSVPLSGWWLWEDLDLDYMDSTSTATASASGRCCTGRFPCRRSDRRLC
jgi:hypothetical protein